MCLQKLTCQHYLHPEWSNHLQHVYQVVVMSIPPAEDNYQALFNDKFELQWHSSHADYIVYAGFAMSISGTSNCSPPPVASSDMEFHSAIHFSVHPCWVTECAMHDMLWAIGCSWLWQQCCVIVSLSSKSSGDVVKTQMYILHPSSMILTTVKTFL